MKGLMIALLFSSQLLLAQNEIAIFYANAAHTSVSAKGADEVTVAPFDLLNGMIVVKASVDGSLGNFILDTGSPGLVINSTEHKEGAGYKATSIGGELEIGELAIKNFKWGIVEKQGITGYTIDLSHLEDAAGLKLTGLIGFEVLKDYELFFDYPNETIKIYNAKDAKLLRRENVVQEVSFVFNGHVPVIPVKVGNKKVYLGLDSGAEVNLLEDSYFKTIKKSFLKSKQKELVIGLDQKKKHAISAIIEPSTVKNFDLNEMKFLFMDLGALESEDNVRMDGLLGFPLFQNHAVSINYQERKVYFWN